nr:RES family NAD+ phosphorylase [Marinibactrum halimedae]
MFEELLEASKPKQEASSHQNDKLQDNNLHNNILNSNTLNNSTLNNSTLNNNNVNTNNVNTNNGWHYLLTTPFRYPPLLWGSRFGRRFEPSLLYGSKSIQTLLAECAYYRFIFWHGMETPPPTGKLNSQHLIFSATYRSEKGAQLQRSPFNAYEEELLHHSNYESCQELGSWMRELGIEAFEYTSARCQAKGTNVALFTKEALTCQQPLEQQPWLCELTKDRVTFSGTYYRSPLNDGIGYLADSNSLITFDAEVFLCDGKLPSPA